MSGGYGGSRRALRSQHAFLVLLVAVIALLPALISLARTSMYRAEVELVPIGEPVRDPVAEVRRLVAGRSLRGRVDEMMGPVHALSTSGWGGVTASPGPAGAGSRVRVSVPAPAPRDANAVADTIVYWVAVLTRRTPGAVPLKRATIASMPTGNWADRAYEALGGDVTAPPEPGWAGLAGLLLGLALASVWLVLRPDRMR